MKKKTVYTDAPQDVEAALDAAVRIDDVLPSPEELMASERKAEKKHRRQFLFRH